MKRQTLDSILTGHSRRGQRARPALLGTDRGRARERPVPDRPRGRCLDGARAIRGRRDPLPAPCRRRRLRGHALDAACRSPPAAASPGLRARSSCRGSSSRTCVFAALLALVFFALRQQRCPLPLALGLSSVLLVTDTGPAGRDLDLRRRVVGCVPGRRADPRPAEADSGLGCRRRRPLRARLAEQDCPRSGRRPRSSSGC